MVLPGSDKGDYDAVSETWFGCNIPWLQPRCISISSNLDKAIVYPRGRPSAWLNPIDMAAACGECFSPGGAAPGWFQRFGGGGTSCCPGVLTRLPGDDAYLQMMLDRLRGPGVWDDCATFGFIQASQSSVPSVLKPARDWTMAASPRSQRTAVP